MMRYVVIFALLFPIILFGNDQTLPDSQLLLMKSDSPLIAFRILLLTGSAQDPSGKEGIASLTASMMAEGSTQRNDYEKILKLLFPMAAYYASQADKEMTVFYGVVHKDHLMPYYHLLRDAVLFPAFKQEDFDRLKADQLNYVSKTLRFNDDEELGKEVLSRAIFKDHPYGHPNAGRVSSVSSLTLQDVKNFYRQQFTQKNLVLGIAGGYTDELIAQIKKDFAALPAGEIKNKLPEPAKIEGIHVILVEKEAPATAISFGFPISFTRADEDFYPMLVANAWLGQHRNQMGHLFKVMRELRGLNYGDYSYIEYFPYGGRYFQPLPNVARRQQYFQVWIRPIQHPNRHFALRQAIRELQMLIDNGMTEKDFELTRNFIQNYSVTLAQSNSEMLGYALDDRFFDLKQPFLEHVKSKLSSLKLEEVNHAIKKHLNAKNMVIVAITKDTEAYKKALVENVPSPIQYDSPKPEPVLEEDKLIQGYPIAIKEESVTILPVEKVFQ